MSSVTYPGVSYEPTRLEIPDDLSVPDFLELLRTLGGIAKGHQWWVGDALVHGETHYGEADLAQYAEELGLEPHTVTNWRWVAAAVEQSRRRDELTWSHHAEVARLKPKQQEKALKWAVEGEHGVRELRDYVALTWPTGEQPDPEPHDDRDDVFTNRRLEEIERNLESGYDGEVDGLPGRLLDDVHWLLSIARKAIRS